MSAAPRVRRAGSFALAVLVLGLAAGCGSSPDHSRPAPEGLPPPPRSSGLPDNCSGTVSDPDQVAAAVRGAQPGDTLCFSGAKLADLVIEMTTSGLPGRPISLIGGGTTLRSIGVNADHVVVDGFVLAEGDGLNLKGDDLEARNNVVLDATDDGIVCVECVGGTIESNTVWRADGTGIVIDGERSLVRDNTVRESVMREQRDADGVRFFGTGLRLIGNTIRDIKTTDYPERQAPHTDCFQTYDTRDSRPTYDVVIVDNVCENVDVQCLIATSNETRSTEVPTGVTSILFEHNICSVNGSQGILLESFPNVVVRDNTFSGPRYRAVLLARGSVNGTVVDNTVLGNIPPFEIDDESRPGFHADGNNFR
ncbi:MAG TPA: right-handed parallel beta-helix repeat-containing protein [Pseudonocardiaceae bacterium]|nr:right-handed parallel beta-helix repeat-containing protein [Pseudonocardiaceae bacterium]